MLKQAHAHRRKNEMLVLIIIWYNHASTDIHITLLSKSSALEAKPSSHWTILRHNCAVWSTITNWHASRCEVVGNCHKAIHLAWVVLINSTRISKQWELQGGPRRKLDIILSKATQLYKMSKYGYQEKIIWEFFISCKKRTKYLSIKKQPSKTKNKLEGFSTASDYEVFIIEHAEVLSFPHIFPRMIWREHNFGRDIFKVDSRTEKKIFFKINYLSRISTTVETK